MAAARRMNAWSVEFWLSSCPRAAADGGVWVEGRDAGRARRAADVAELLRRAGINPARMTDTSTVEWRGGGPQSWR
ncbi:hypothetical protein [Streptomyces sp. NPDC060366]|uniref:hypothetical protein n=1 Tax=Streptomyces sp. NPDC060366 TaxID=3347105 RepID=UPI00365608B7